MAWVEDGLWTACGMHLWDDQGIAHACPACAAGAYQKKPPARSRNGYLLTNREQRRQRGRANGRKVSRDGTGLTGAQYENGKRLYG